MSLQLSPVVETDLRIEVSRRQLQKAALDFMVSIYGKPCDIEDPELKERFYGRLGLLVNFIVEVVPE